MTKAHHPTKKQERVLHVDSILTAVTDASSDDDSTSTAACSRQDSSCTTTTRSNFLTLPYTTALPLLVALDMVGVSLVVPLLSSRYYQLAGVTSAVQREWLSSIFSASQIVGGLVIGALADSRVLSRHFILLLSFFGSALAYAMITFPQGGLTAILVSRVLVGLVKQTMTVTTSILAHATEEKERATHMGRLNAGATVAWILGPSAGAYLFSHVGTYAPIYVSCSLFLLNCFIVLFCLPKEEEDDDHDNENDVDVDDDKKRTSQNNQSTSAIGRIRSNFQACFHSSNACLASTVVALLLFHWVSRTTSYKNISTYYEVQYGTEPHQRGYLQSYQSALSFVVQSSLIQPILHALGGEVNAACAASLLMAVATLAEWSLPLSFSQYLVLICPPMGISVAILAVSLKSVVSKAAPKASLSSVFATVDILQNVAVVTVPFYRTLLFRIMADDDNDVAGDPDPKQWLLSSGLHWMVATAALSYLLLKRNPCAASTNNNKEEGSSKIKTS